MTVAEKQEALIGDFMIIEDVQERLAAVVSRSASQHLPEAEKIEANLVKGCVSRVWLDCQCLAGQCQYRADADSPMVKGLVCLLCEVYDGGQPAEIVSTEPELWVRLGFQKNLSPTRLNGLAAVRQQIQAFAQSCQ